MTDIKWEDLPFVCFDKNLAINGWQIIKSRCKYYNNQNHTRIVCEDKHSKTILKIWPQDYVRGKYFHQAFKKGFFDYEVAPSNIRIIIDNEGVCRGYSMTKGLSVNNINDDILDEFSYLLIKKVEETNFFYYDLCSENLMLFGDKYGLIDLDSIYPFDEYEEWRDHKHKGGKMVKRESYESQLDKLAKEIHDT